MRDRTLFASIATGIRPETSSPDSVNAPSGRSLVSKQIAVVAELVEQGVFSEVPATDGLVATAWTVRERGTAVFVTNPTERSVTGGVFPAIPELTVPARETVLALLDFAIGPSHRYLAAYAGLVKATVPVMHAAVRADPHPGASIVVAGFPGGRTELVVFHSGRGVGVPISFSASPSVHRAESCLITAWPMDLAERWRIDQDDTQRAGSWRVGPDGAIARWRVAHVAVPTECSARLDPLPAEARIDGKTVNPSDLALPAGTIRVEALWPEATALGDVLLVPDGACWAVGIDDWQPCSEEFETA